MPISTIFDRIKKYQNTFIKRNTILVDFKRMGYELRVNILIKTKPESRADLRKYFETHFNVNTVYRINNGYDFMVEVLFKNLKIDGAAIGNAEQLRQAGFDLSVPVRFEP